MKKIISMFLAFLLLIQVNNSVYAAMYDIDLHDEQSYTYHNGDGDEITIHTVRTGNSITARLYKNDVLMQEATVDSTTKHVQASIYVDDSPAEEDQIYSVGEFTVTSTEYALSDESQAIMQNNHCDHSNSSNESPMMFSTISADVDPRDNTGLQYYGDNFYLLQNFSGGASTPLITGDIIRKCSSEYIGETAYYQFEIGTPLTIIVGVIMLVAWPPLIGQVLIDIGIYFVGEYLENRAAIQIETISYDYYYEARILGNTYFTASKNRTYWKFNNSSTGLSTYELSSPPSGYPSDNQTMFNQALDYFLSNVPHVYETACSTTCTVCGGGRTVNHDYQTKNTTSNHYKECTICKKTSDSAAHTMGSWTNTNDPTHESRYCTSGCGYSEKQAHPQWSEGWSAVGGACTGGYWKKQCVSCAYYENTYITSHTGGTATCTEAKKCTRCGEAYGNTLGHSYDTWVKTSTEHYKSCSRSGCTAKNSQGSHTYGTGTTCTSGCGQIHTHASSSTWTRDSTSHWKACTTSGCAYKYSSANHSYGTGTSCTSGTHACFKHYMVKRCQ